MVLVSRTGCIKEGRVWYEDNSSNEVVRKPSEGRHYTLHTHRTILSARPLTVFGSIITDSS
jgi:hypothetical protein